MFTGAKPATNISKNTLTARKNFNLAHSKSRVANILSTPGNFKYTNKERIEKKYQQALEELKKIDNPREARSALQTIHDKLKAGIQSQGARETGAVVITLPVGIAQLALKVLLLFIAAIGFIFDIGTQTTQFGPHLMPNTSFNTTKTAYNKARTFTGAKKPNTPQVKNY